jgi:hypothetical protein
MGSGYHSQFVADTHFETSRGVVPGRYGFHRFGYNPSVTTTEEDVWFNGGTYPWPTSALPLRVKAGGNANDTSAGTGARTVTILGLNASFAEISETVTLAGASASSPTTQSFIRVTRAWVATSGTYTGSNTGNVVIETTSGSTLANLAAGVGQTQLSMYTVPAGYTAWLHRLMIVPDASKQFTMRMYRRSDADDTSAPFTAKRIVTVVPVSSTPTEIDYQVNPSFPAKTDLWFTGQTAAGTGSCGVHYDLVMVAD